MTAHDPLCDEVKSDIYFCICDVIAKARAGEAREHLLRAEERELGSALAVAFLRAQRADLRAKVAALPLIDYSNSDQELIDRADVLALFDGGSDGDA